MIRCPITGELMDWEFPILYESEEPIGPLTTEHSIDDFLQGDDSLE